MFVLLKRVRAWHAEMQARGVLAAGELTELEDHLLEEASHLAEDGRSDEEAFAEAVRRLGTEEELCSEFRVSHELSGSTAKRWAARLVAWGLCLCRWAQAITVFCLPGLVMAVPGLVAGRALQGNWWPLFTDYGMDIPAGTKWSYRVVELIAANWWWCVPLALAALLWPTVHRIRLARDRSGGRVGAVFAEELAEARWVLLAGVVAYPLVGMGFLRMVFEPLFRLLDALGG